MDRKRKGEFLPKTMLCKTKTEESMGGVCLPVIIPSLVPRWQMIQDKMKDLSPCTTRVNFHLISAIKQQLQCSRQWEK